MTSQIYTEILALYADYAAVVDSTDWNQWPEFFLEDGAYRLQPRENFDAGLPLCLLALESRAMIMDRVYGVRETMYHDPYYQRHVVGIPRLLSVTQTEAGEVIEAEANYIVFRTKRDGVSEVFNAGRYRDTLQRTSDGLKFRLRLCIYDTEMVSNSLIYPI